jgi:tRNA(Ile)-lysidine synthase
LQAAEADELITELAAELAVDARVNSTSKEVSYQVETLAKAAGAIRSKAILLIAKRAGASNISSAQIEQVDALITNWHGQKPASLSGITVERVKDLLVFSITKPISPGAC